MTGDNHLTEIEACYDGSTDVVQDVEKAVSKIEAGDYIRGFAEIGIVINEFPKALTSCKNMDDDIAAIESWATIFTEPEKLAKTLSKNWLLHRRTIKEDLSNESNDWATGQYFQAGVDTAMALTEAVGPIETQTNEAATNDLKTIPEFVAGFIYGVTGDLQLDQLETCMTSASDLEQYVAAMLGDLKSLDILSALWDMQKFVYHMQKDLIPC